MVYCVRMKTTSVLRPIWPWPWVALIPEVHCTVISYKVVATPATGTGKLFKPNSVTKIKLDLVKRQLTQHSVKSIETWSHQYFLHLRRRKKVFTIATFTVQHTLINVCLVTSRCVLVTCVCRRCVDLGYLHIALRRYAPRWSPSSDIAAASCQGNGTRIALAALSSCRRVSVRSLRRRNTTAWG